MKNIITAAALALGLTVTAAAPVKAMGTELCSPLADAAGSMATLRDQGYGPQEVYDLLLQNGVADEVAVILLKLVYVDASFASPEEIEGTMFTICLSTST